MSMVKMRQLVEREIATALIDVFLAAEFSISIDNGDNGENEYEIFNSKDKAAILAAMFKTDEERMYIHKGGEDDLNPFAWVYLVYGNDGWDCISDHTTNLEQYISKGPANDVVEKYMSY